MPHCIRKMLAWHNSIYQTVGSGESVVRLSVARVGKIDIRQKQKSRRFPSGFLITKRDQATSSYCGTGLRKLLVTQAR